MPDDISESALTKHNDHDLVARARRGDHAAYTVLVRHYMPKIRRLALSILHNETEAEDAVQDIFLSLLKNLGKWNPEGPAKFSTWVYRISFNKCIDLKRKRKPATPAEDLDLLSTDNDGYKNTLQKEVSKKLQHLLKTLPAAQHQALAYYYYRDLSVLEISQKMNKTQQSVRALLKRGKAALRHNISEKQIY